jgi:hypothetical protein
MHRLIWDLTWKTSGGEEIDDFEVVPPRGPRVVPGAYRVRLTVDGKSQVQPLTIAMDPRSSATAGELDQQFQLGRTMFSAAMESRQTLAEIMSVQKQLSAASQKTTPPRSELQAAVSQIQYEIRRILKGSGEPSGDAMGLEQAVLGLTGALKVVESSDRTIPSQAMELYQESNQAWKLHLEEWDRLKKTRLPQLNDLLKQANMAPLVVGEVDPDEADSVSD